MISGREDQSMANLVTFSVTVVPINGAHGINGAHSSFRETVLSLRTSELRDCFLSVFHIGDSYALLSGEALAAPHTTTNAALRAYLLPWLSGDDPGLDFHVKIDRR
jgi:hypothetical protein